MQTVSSIFSGFGSGGGGSTPMDDFGNFSPSGGGGASGGSGNGLSSSTLSDFRAGTSAISAMSSYAMSQSQAQAMNMEATDEDLAARGEYVTAQQKSNEINRQFNRVRGAQLADASAMGVDIGSGSVIEAGRQAQQSADRQTLAVQTTAQINAQQRLSRAAMLRQSASQTSAAGGLTAVADIAKTALQFAAMAG